MNSLVTASKRSGGSSTEAPEHEQLKEPPMEPGDVIMDVNDVDENGETRFTVRGVEDLGGHVMCIPNKMKCTCQARAASS